MPFYDFQCTNKECPHEEEMYVKLAEYEKKEYDSRCPKCGNEIIQKIGLVQFKLSSGFWEHNGYSDGSQKELDSALETYDHHKRVEDAMDTLDPTI